ncbi:hypothetical protein QNH46_01920 [Paenibacillus woosongensis]|uniref:Sublancin immunity protein SunI-like PH domain-containing protein n=1 Tax=Paenibacillus woosongensis TaxID=307580 RepID=A0AA95IC53_9BACL|nr:hypothetical protein [Paenibacillus woosongensis]WHX49473.1 hypothetical protein QNH46_01920 [Paenibacillus woosongensis]
MYIVLSIGIVAAILFIFAWLFSVSVSFQGEHLVIRHLFNKLVLSKQEISHIEVADQYLTDKCHNSPANITPIGFNRSMDKVIIHTRGQRYLVPVQSIEAFMEKYEQFAVAK